MTIDRYNRIKGLLQDKTATNATELVAIYKEETSNTIKVGCLCKQNNINIAIEAVQAWFYTITEPIQ